MNKQATVLCGALVACALGAAELWGIANATSSALPNKEDEGQPSLILQSETEHLNHPATDRKWIVGKWRSYKLDYGDFGEWEGTKQIELIASSPDEIGLFLISADGNHSRAGDSEGSLMDERKLFFGPIGSGLLFHYRHSGNVLILDLN